MGAFRIFIFIFEQANIDWPLTHFYGTMGNSQIETPIWPSLPQNKRSLAIMRKVRSSNDKQHLKQSFNLMVPSLILTSCANLKIKNKNPSHVFLGFFTKQKSLFLSKLSTMTMNIARRLWSLFNSKNTTTSHFWKARK